MYRINRKSIALLFSLLFAIGLGFTACDADEEDFVPPKTLEEYKTELSEIIRSEKQAVQNCVVGYNKGDFKSDLFYEQYTTDYLAALMTAEEILAKHDLTIADVMAANKLISPSGKLFNDNIWISDRRDLNDLIGECDTLYVHTPEGTEPGMAPAEARSEFKTEINSAKSVRGRSSTIDRQVDEAIEELNIALDVFEEAIIK